MTNALAWLNDLMTWLGKWVPRLVLIPATHKGVRFGPRGGTKSVGPGLVVYWPISHSIIQIPVTTLSVQLNSQMICSEISSGTAVVIPQVVMCAVAVQFRVIDVVKAATRALHFHALVDNRSSAAIARHAVYKDRPLDWMELAAKDVREELKPYGIQLERLDITQNGVGIAVKNLSDWNFTDPTDGKSLFTQS